MIDTTPFFALHKRRKNVALLVLGCDALLLLLLLLCVPQLPLWSGVVLWFSWVAVRVSKTLRPWFQTLSKQDLTLALDLLYPNIAPSLYEAPPQHPVWGLVLAEHILNFRNKNHKRMRKRIGIVVLLGILFMATHWNQSKTNMIFNPTLDLEIQQGALTTEFARGQISLKARDPKKISLGSPNLVALRCSTCRSPLAVQLQGAKGTGVQTFTLLPKQSLTFTVEHSSVLIVESISKNPLVEFQVQGLGQVQVELTAEGLSNPWPAEQALPLLVSAEADQGIASVEFIVSVGEAAKLRPIEIGKAHIKKFQQPFTLELEAFLEDLDSGEVAIQARVVDLNTPPSEAVSQAIRVQVVSQYGRYRSALEKMRTVRSEVASAILKHQPLSEDGRTLFAKVETESYSITFFDEYDRVQIHDMNKKTKGDQTQLRVLDHQLSTFLEEHESLDDRERDRDFFVSLRDLSWQIEHREKTVSESVTRLSHFVEQRSIRWKARVARLPEDLIGADFPKRIEGEYWVVPLQESVKPEVDGAAELAKLAEEYEKWLTELESAEDEAFARMREEKMAAIRSANADLEQVRQRQDSISVVLDNSAHEGKKVAESWPSLRLKENTNIKATKEITEKLQPFSPEAAVRLNGAVEAMENTNQFGDSARYTDAESSSDFASRLLRLAKQKNEQQTDSRRNERRRRTLGNQDWGQNLLGQPIQIKIGEKDHKTGTMREQILQEFIFDAEQRNESLFENYLRTIIR